VPAIFTAEAKGKPLALDLELGRPRQSHPRSIVGLGVAVNLLCFAATWMVRIT
jgi:hypothetical protein